MLKERLQPQLRRPLCGWLRLRPAYAAHTPTEKTAIRKWATGRRRLVELGVAEGASALEVRRVMAPDAILWLVDPFFPGRLHPLNPTKRVAHRELAKVGRGEVDWVEELSWDAAKGWSTPLDFLLIDADHSYEGVCRDWTDWSPHVERGGVVLLHDARVWEGGWTNQVTGPVRLVDETFRDGDGEWSILEEECSLVVVRREA